MENMERFNRLTKKEYKHLIYSSGYYNKKQTSKLDEVYHKLGKLEDLEEELGCPLEIVVEAIKKGIVVKPYEDEYGDITLWNSRKETELDITVSKLNFEEPELLFFDNWVFSCSSGCYRGCVKLKDYKKTWWLPSDKEWKDD